MSLNTACYTDIDIDDNEPDVLVINSIAEADSTVTARITRTWSYVEDNPDATVSDAVVKLMVNGTLVESMSYDSRSKNFVSHYTARQGDRIAIEATSDLYGKASCMETVPGRIDIDDLDVSVIKRIDYNSIVAKPDGTFDYGLIYEIHYQLSFNDPEQTSDYYLLTIGSYGSAVFSQFDFSTEPLFSEQETILDDAFSLGDKAPIFTDESINGKRYTLNFIHKIDAMFAHHDYTDRISLCHISESYYKYLLSIHKSESGIGGALGDIGLSDPVQIYTNVTGGTGILGGSANSHIDVKLTPYLQDADSEGIN